MRIRPAVAIPLLGAATTVGLVGLRAAKKETEAGLLLCVAAIIGGIYGAAHALNGGWD